MDSYESFLRSLDLKGLKKFANQPKKLMELYYFIDNYLRTGATIPDKYRAHMLHGDYVGHMECHIGGDFLLIWIDETKKPNKAY